MHYYLHILTLHVFLTDVTLSHSAQIGANSVVGSATSIGDQCNVLNSVIGVGCKIGKNVLINGSYIWDNVIIEDGCKVSNSLVCDGVHLRSGAIVQPGCVLSFKVSCYSIDITTPDFPALDKKNIICSFFYLVLEKMPVHCNGRKYYIILYMYITNVPIRYNGMSDLLCGHLNDLQLKDLFNNVIMCCN